MYVVLGSMSDRTLVQSTNAAEDDHPQESTFLVEHANGADEILGELSTVEWQDLYHGVPFELQVCHCY